jgi:heme-degrading monooxygenase HmoA
MFVVIWEFVVKPGQGAAFEAAYGPDGDWARLFKLHSGFVAVELLCDAEAPDRYVTIDTWRRPEDYVKAMAASAAAYQELDARCAALTASEKRLGNFVK